MTPESIRVFLFGGAVDSVRIAAVASSRKVLVFWNLRRSTSGGIAPHVTICSLFRSFLEARLRSASKETSRASWFLE